jgi:hypothetical protein
MLIASKLKLQALPPRCYWIYALVDPRNDEVRYIGQSLNPYKRLSEHLYPMDSRNKQQWIGELAVAGLKPRIGIIESAQTVDTARDSEQYWISYCLRLGARLLNDPRFERQTGGRPRRSGK